MSTHADAISALEPLREGPLHGAVLLCLPGAGAQVGCFQDLAAAMPASFSVFGLEGPRAALAPAGDRVQREAAAHERALLRYLPGRALHIVAHSFGAWPAFELACRLQRTRAPLSLTLLDAGPPSLQGILQRRLTLAEAFAQLARTIGQDKALNLRLAAQDFTGLGQDACSALLHERMVGAGILSPRSHPALLTALAQHCLADLATPWLPSMSYDGSVTLVRAAASVADEGEAPVEGWRRVAAQLRVASVGGDHMSMLKPPHAAALARLLVPAAVKEHQEAA